MRDVDPDRQVFLRAWYDGLVPPEEMTVTQWAEKYRVISGEGSIDPGPFIASKTPYTREILDALHPDSGIRRVVWMKGSQVGGSETGNNWLGYLIDRAPGAIMVVQPTRETAKRYSRTRIAPMLRDSPRLAEIVPVSKSRDAENTLFEKHFRGGVLLIAGANSAAMLRSQPLRYLMLDEVDNWPLDVDGEGDPAKLAEARMRWGFSTSKLFMVSSPKLKGNSRIEAGFVEGDRRYWHVACPHCRTFQHLEWRNLWWEKNPDKPETAAYRCEECGTLIDESHKAAMLAGGEWRPTAESKDPAIRSYHLNSLYSPPGSFTWADIVREWISAHASGSPLLLQVFVNTILGETWAGTGEAPEAELLYERSRASKYSSGFIPAGGLVLTAGVDVQKDRLECEVVAWGRNGERWSIEYHIFPGEHVLPEVWKNLDALLAKSWPHEGGSEMQLHRMAVDCAFDQSTVARWIRKASRDKRVMGIHGTDRIPVILGQPRRADLKRDGKVARRGFVLWPVGSSVAKTELYGRLRIRPPVGDEPHAPGYCHFPRDYNLTYFTQLTSEKLVFEQTRTGASRPVWQKKGRNEALDCAVYARAAAASYGIDRMKDADWDSYAEALGVAPRPAPAQAPHDVPTSEAPIERAAKPAPRDKPRAGRGGSWMSRWRGGRK